MSADVPAGVAALCRFTGDWEVIESDEYRCTLRSGDIEARFQIDCSGEWIFDEVVGKDVFLHIEQMDDSYYWIGITQGDSTPEREHRLCVDIGSRSRRAKVHMTGWSE